MNFLGIMLWMVILPGIGGASAQTLTEDFTTLEHADPASSTGIWNTVDHSARAKAYADSGTSNADRPIDFGNGSDGVVNASSGFTFDTDSHPSGYQFQSLAITGGVITVKGSHPLIIRSLSGITILPDLKVNGGTGANGASNGSSSVGGAATTCLARGGNGGVAPAASDGGNATYWNGSTESGTQGTGQAGAYVGTPSSPGPIEPTSSSVITGPVWYDFETDPSNDFICGTSGAGGGASTDAGSLISGGAGGAGGGVLQLVAVGDINVGVTEAIGGDGGSGWPAVGGSPTGNGACSGRGLAGNGGVIFFQTLGTLTTGTDPNVSGGTSGTSLCFPTGNSTGLEGTARGDSASGVAPSWSTVSTFTGYDTVSVPTTPANLQSYVQSKAYDLGVLNASFSDETVTSTGTVAMTYAGSADGVTFSDFTDLKSLSNQGYRFLKFRATFTNSTSTSARVTALSVPYTDLGLAALNTKIFAGCGSLAMVGRAAHSKSNPKNDEAGFLFTLVSLVLFYGMSRLRLERLS